MGLDGCGKCMKYTMIVANFFIMVGGFAVMSVGIWTCADKSSFEKLLGSDLYMSAAYILIATGVIVVIISVIGCFGALRDIKCLLLAYFIILFIIFVTMLVGGILGCVFRNQVGEKMKARMKKTILTDYLQPGVKDTWDAVQSQLKCCGTSLEPGTASVLSWKESPNYETNKRVPESCCTKKDGKIENVKACTEQDPVSQFVYMADCYNKTIDVVEQHALVIGGVGIGIACILILGMIFSLVLFKVIE